MPTFTASVWACGLTRGRQGAHGDVVQRAPCPAPAGRLALGLAEGGAPPHAEHVADRVAAVLRLPYGRLA
ncbi:hypothetical protein [Streptomyces marianii]|uniref:hypothetical protein n=1 Tax=Streptomyces marianii TaxID=1817406 RepID=UPI001485F4D7|nr:hypothetical protein [Streptomyces marianii]